MKNEKFQLSQSAYIDQILEEFDVDACRTYVTQMTSNFYDELSMHQGDTVIEEKYHNMTGCLKILSHRSRQYISTAVGILSQSASKPTSFTLKSLKRIFGYLRGTSNYRLRLNLNNKAKDILEFYSDANFSRNKTYRRSRSGWLAKCYGLAFL